ncbi:hypothetical protein [Janthinobacterium sp. UMAB-56]|uniref:hypothetical protein n=1 Tax=Janthinobacterium sp. UMAB-56 TaxID=1365361 RepID=UPI001C59407D|nr:hypothetical protein [Janthinobacterium sp. UMAB-56]
MMRKMILLGAALSLSVAGNTHAASTSPVQMAAYRAAPSPQAVRLAYFQPPQASLRVPTPQEPRTHSLLLVAIGLLGLRMHSRTRNDKFHTLT